VGSAWDSCGGFAWGCGLDDALIGDWVRMGPY